MKGSPGARRGTNTHQHSVANKEAGGGVGQARRRTKGEKSLPRLTHFPPPLVTLRIHQLFSRRRPLQFAHVPVAGGNDASGRARQRACGEVFFEDRPGMTNGAEGEAGPCRLVSPAAEKKTTCCGLRGAIRCVAPSGRGDVPCLRGYMVALSQ